MARWSDEQIDALLRRQRGLPVPTVGGEQPSARWPALFQFLAGYLHQDFDINGTPEDCIALAIEQRDADERAAVLTELRELRDQRWSEDALARALDDLGMSYLPYADDRTHADWVDWMVEELTQRS